MIMATSLLEVVLKDFGGPTTLKSPCVNCVSMCFSNNLIPCLILVSAHAVLRCAPAMRLLCPYSLGGGWSYWQASVQKTKWKWCGVIAPQRLAPLKVMTEERC